MQFMVLYLYKLAFLRLHCIFFIVLFFFAVNDLKTNGLSNDGKPQITCPTQLY